MAVDLKHMKYESHTQMPPDDPLFLQNPKPNTPVSILRSLYIRVHPLPVRGIYAMLVGASQICDA